MWLFRSGSGCSSDQEAWICQAAQAAERRTGAIPDGKRAGSTDAHVGCFCGSRAFRASTFQKGSDANYAMDSLSDRLKAERVLQMSLSVLK